MPRILALLAVVTGRWSARVVVLLAVLLGGGFIALAGSAATNNDPTAGLPRDAQSTIVSQLQQRLPGARTTPALVVYSRDGAALTATDRQAIREQAGELARFAIGGRVAPPRVAPDGRAAVVAVPLAADFQGDRTTQQVNEIRKLVDRGGPDGLRAQVTGAAGFTADIANSFSGADASLLLVTVVVVAVLLLITYRSPVLWIVPLAVVGLADQVAAGIIAIVSRHSGVVFSQATTGIVEVLVFGAGTDYALLLIARYREELRRYDDRREAMRRALRAAGPAVLASGTTVVLALLALLFAVLGDNQALGIGGAIGIATAVVFALVVLPAALVVFPRGLFWPLVPRPDERGRRAAEREGRVWRRIGETTARRPWPVVLASVVLLGVLAAGFVGATYGLSQTQTFRTQAESVDGFDTLARHFPAGAVDPVAVITPAGRAADVLARTRTAPGVASAAFGQRGAGLAEVDVVLTAAPDTAASFDAIGTLRDRLADVPRTYVGGTVATDLDARTATTRDLQVIAPIILVIVLLVLVVLLRALVAPLLLIVTVVATYFAALGAGAWSFRHVFGFAGLDTNVPLLAFLFLVALGVDYNIFLTTRAREETQRVGSRRGIVDALAVTGGVITSAGILLAAVFAVLGVLPIITLTEIGIVVGLGVLLDTLVVRTVLVPALVHLLGERFWLPGRPAPANRPDSDPDPDPEPERAVQPA